MPTEYSGTISVMTSSYLEFSTVHYAPQRSNYSYGLKDSLADFFQSEENFNVAIRLRGMERFDVFHHQLTVRSIRIG